MHIHPSTYVFSITYSSSAKPPTTIHFVKHCVNCFFKINIFCMLSGPGVLLYSDSASPDPGPKVPAVGSPAR